MHLIKTNTQNNTATDPESRHILRLRETGTILPTNQLKTGGYYLFKENFGMVVLVKVIQDISTKDWVGFRLKIKRVLYSPWEIPVGTVFEKVYSPGTPALPNSWHFEPCMLLLKSKKITSHHDERNLSIESML